MNRLVARFFWFKFCTPTPPPPTPKEEEKKKLLAVTTHEVLSHKCTRIYLPFRVVLFSLLSLTLFCLSLRQTDRQTDRQTEKETETDTG